MSNVVALRPKPPARRRRRLTTAQRRELYERERGDKDYPDCNICGLPVTPGQKWVPSHMPVPHCHGGTAMGVAHKRCNLDYWAKVEAPMVAKVNHQYDRHHDIWRSRHPLPGGKDDPRKRTMDGRVVDRRTGEPWRKADP